MSEVADLVVQFTANTQAVQRAIGDRILPVVREAAFRIGRLSLEFYLSQPWHRRLWIDLRTGRFVRNLGDALRALP